MYSATEGNWRQNFIENKNDKWITIFFGLTISLGLPNRKVCTFLLNSNEGNHIIA